MFKRRAKGNNKYIGKSFITDETKTVFTIEEHEKKDVYKITWKDIDGRLFSSPYSHHQIKQYIDNGSWKFIKK